MRFRAVLLAVALLAWLATPPQAFPDRLAVIESSTVDNEMYDGESFSWELNDTMGGLYSLNGARIPYFVRMWRTQGAPGKRMLDVGCGGGIATNPLAREGFAMTGVDFSPRSIARARAAAEREGVAADYVVGSAYALPFADASFDGVVCSDVMEHLHDLRQWAREVHRVLKPGGVLVFDTINR